MPSSLSSPSPPPLAEKNDGDADAAKDLGSSGSAAGPGDESSTAGPLTSLFAPPLGFPGNHSSRRAQDNNSSRDRPSDLLEETTPQSVQSALDILLSPAISYAFGEGLTNPTPNPTPSLPSRIAITANDTSDSSTTTRTTSPAFLSGLFNPPSTAAAAAAADPLSNERTSLLSDASSSSGLGNNASTTTATTTTTTFGDEGMFHRIKEVRLQQQEGQSHLKRRGDSWRRFCSCCTWTNHPWTQSILEHPTLQSILQPTTVVGALMFLLYHVVFVLAFGSAIMRPHALDDDDDENNNNNGQILGIMAKWVTVGIVGAGPIYIYRLNQDIPAVYPSVDLFLAPFFAQAAALVDESLWEQSNEAGRNGRYPDSIFFGSFAVLTSIGMFFAGIFLWLGSKFKLANLGTYLPYSVLSGFFSAVGVLLWCLAFSVDTNGKTWKNVFFSGDLQLIGSSCWHHAPSLFMGIIMNRLGPKNPFYVILLILFTISTVYICLWATGHSLKDAQEAGWFWSLDELVYDHRESDEAPERQDGWWLGLQVPSALLPPTPFGSFAAILAGHVNFQAVAAGLGNMAALAFLYLLRSSIHASAMKKNVSNLVRRIPIKKTSSSSSSSTSLTTATTGRVIASSQNGTPVSIDLEDHDDDDEEGDVMATIATGNKSPKAHTAPTMFDRMTESVRIVQMSMEDRRRLHRNRNPSRHSSTSLQKGDEDANQDDTGPGYIEIRAKAPRRSLEGIFSEYAYTLFAVSAFGGFGVCPTVATSNTMFAIGAEGAAPQYASILLLIFFYFLDFRMVEYIPKTAFSSLLVLGSVDTLVVWFFRAFQKTQDLAEWLVVPLIAGFSLFVGFLNAVFLGIAISMFVFVASFFRVSVVKYSATGLEIRSRIERSMAESAWLHDNGDLCQVLVLQNYLFFGNASSILNYIATMFEEVDETQSQQLDFSIPPIPKILVLDLSLVSGMDTSTVDIFAEMYAFCQNNDCKLFLCGLSTRMKKGLELGGVKPDQAGPRSKSNLRFFSNLDTALGRAEDTLIQTLMLNPAEQRRDKDNTLRRMASIKSTETLEGNSLGFRRALNQIDELHGLSFTVRLVDLQSYTEVLELRAGDCLYQADGGIVEESRRGLFFIEEGLLKIERDSSHSLTWTRSSLGAGSSQDTLKNQHARIGSVARRGALARTGGKPNLRLARLGPGWICGTLDFGTGIRTSGIAVAVTKCRLHLLPFNIIQQLEQDDPALALSLYKLVTRLRAHREEATIEQLTTLNDILTSPAHAKPISRKAFRSLGA